MSVEDSAVKATHILCTHVMMLADVRLSVLGRQMVGASGGVMIFRGKAFLTVSASVLAKDLG